MNNEAERTLHDLKLRECHAAGAHLKRHISWTSLHCEGHADYAPARA